MRPLQGIVSKFKKEKKAIPREKVLRARPIRNPLIKWEEEEEGVRLTIPLKKSTKLKILTFLFRVPETKEVVLDDVGSNVWLLCNSENTVADVVKALSEKHKMTRKEVEVSLFSYLQQLAKRGYIGLEMKKGDELDLGLIKKGK